MDLIIKTVLLQQGVVCGRIYLLDCTGNSTRVKEGVDYWANLGEYRTACVQTPSLDLPGFQYATAEKVERDDLPGSACHWKVQNIDPLRYRQLPNIQLTTGLGCSSLDMHSQ